MIVVPDTQNYSQRFRDGPQIFEFITQWMVDNKDSLKIGLVVTEGDIVQNPGNRFEWQKAKSAISTLDGHLPYVLATGNHDHGSTADPRSTLLNDYFSATDNPLNDPAQGGILRGTREPGHLENAYYEFAAPDGRNLLITSLEWGPRDGTVAWANDIVGLSQYRDHTAMLTTHAYLNHDGVRFDFVGSGDSQLFSPYHFAVANDPDGLNDGEELWQKLISPNPNYELVVSGHIHDDQVGRLTSLNHAGEPVHQMVFNAQKDPNGGDGWLRILEFLDDGKTVHARTFSPWLESLGQPAERFSDDYNFFLTLSDISVPEPTTALMLIIGLSTTSILGMRRLRDDLRTR